MPCIPSDYHRLRLYFNNNKNNRKLTYTWKLNNLYLNIIKTIYSTTTANIKLNGKELEAVTLKSGKDRAAHSLPIYLI